MVSYWGNELKYIYIAGVEHSGTTLTNYLLSCAPNAIGLGEVTQFFDPEHMRLYMQRWGANQDVELCSCLNKWNECDFWSQLQHLYGLNSDTNIADKYRALWDFVNEHYGSSSIIIDSSKSLEAFQSAINSMGSNLQDSDVHIVFTCKDVRGFAASILRKTSASSLLAIYRSFNWWVSENAQWLEFLDKRDYRYTINLYEFLCLKPDELVNKVINKPNAPVFNGMSHIAIGNKNFTLRNSHHIRYDDRWRSNWKIKLVYFFHIRARLLNTRLYNLAFKA